MKIKDQISELNKRIKYLEDTRIRVSQIEELAFDVHNPPKYKIGETVYCCIASTMGIVGIGDEGVVASTRIGNCAQHFGFARWYNVIIPTLQKTVDVQEISITCKNKTQ